jgi:hypothetical protein
MVGSDRRRCPAGAGVTKHSSASNVKRPALIVREIRRSFGFSPFDEFTAKINAKQAEVV